MSCRYSPRRGIKDMKTRLTKFSLATGALAATTAVATLWVVSAWLTQTTPAAVSLPAGDSPVVQHPMPVDQAHSTADMRAHTDHPMAESTTRETSSTAFSDVASLKQFQQGLRAYHDGELDQEDKIEMEKSLRELNATVMGRSFIVDTFFSTDEPRLADIMHELILDADVKDVSLVVALIDRDKAEYSLTSKKKIVDLIADMAAQEQQHYSPEIDEYLAQLSQHPNTSLRNAAKSQRAWYVTQHQPDNMAIVEEYLLDSSPDLRQEMYDLIAARSSANALSNPSALALALQSLLHADYLDISLQEQEQVLALSQELGIAMN